ncbi:hypothetical protein [Nostoc sp.]|uniref:hypothetical protein n=1 Tax=Nostoc sp. TaxID=1180 RepID=UPI002FFA94E8
MENGVWGMGSRQQGEEFSPLPVFNAQCPMPNALFQQIVDNLLKNHLYLSVHFHS